MCEGLSKTDYKRMDGRMGEYKCLGCREMDVASQQKLALQGLMVEIEGMGRKIDATQAECMEKR